MAKSTEKQRDTLIREIVAEIMPLLARLSFANCPYCGSRTLVATLKAHSGIFVRCEGVVLRPEEAVDNLEGICLYQACLPLTIEEEKPKLIPFERSGAPARRAEATEL